MGTFFRAEGSQAGRRTVKLLTHGIAKGWADRRSDDCRKKRWSYFFFFLVVGDVHSLCMHQMDPLFISLGSTCMTMDALSRTTRLIKSFSLFFLLKNVGADSY